MKIKLYNRDSAVNYAKTWAYNRNPIYYNFNNLGGDCTNFVSQCVYSGAEIMNYTPVLGWYYNNINDRTPSWSGVEFFYNFLVNNDGVGPIGRIVNFNSVEKADVIFLRRANGELYHTLFVNGVENGQIYVSAHTFDVYNKNLFSYSFNQAVCVHIEHVNIP
ncbi:MAG: amidase domain-containing protein [Clostridia bacterium]|nr:amidase domain-containing protein [Clostridia bacterium]